MSKAQPWGRVAISGAMVAVCVIACDSVLDIEEPKPLAEAGAAGEGEGGNPSAGSATGGKAGGDGSRTMGGEGGELTISVGGGGEGGAPITPECENTDIRCAGDGQKTPEVCIDGKWAQNTDEAESECEILCDAGRCVECKGDDAPRCSVCTEGDENCSQRVVQTCIDGVWEGATQPCEHYCSDGACQEPASCAAGTLASDCSGESCCLSLYVPGGEFKRNYAEMSDFTNPNFPAKVSPFLLDKFEVTVGRMREFVAAYPIKISEGDGKARHIAADPGWSVDNDLPTDVAALKAMLLDCGTSSTWTEFAGSSEKLPINCLIQDVAYAFCIWDGGRLPTETELNFAAAGGDKHRPYPWPAPNTGAPYNPELAVYESANAQPNAVGSKPDGNGLWGQADLAGNVAEMTLDVFLEQLPEGYCEDCVNLDTGLGRVYRGGSYISGGGGLTVPYRQQWDPKYGLAEIGFRCIRDTN